jgi:murein L,D-transpeptidase YcbB/YkuD
MKTIFNLLLITVMAAGLHCTRNDSGKAGEESGNSATVAPTADLPTVDSADLLKYFSFQEKKELGPSLKRFYKERSYKTAWFDGDKPTDAVEAFINTARNAASEGLNPSDYNVNELEKKFAALKESNNGGRAQKAADLDLLLSSEFCNYAIDMKEGITREQKEMIGWFIKESNFKYDSLLRLALSSNAADAFKQLQPQHPQYAQLKAMLASYREMEKKGGWPQVSGVKKLKKGDTSDAVVRLRERLIMTGDLKQGATNFYDPKLFDNNLEMGVKNFQTRHGLEPDGIVAGNTLKALNISVRERIVQVLVNMERWRQVPQHLGSEHFLVNIPEFKLHVTKDNKPAFDMRVIVGKDFKATPIFSDHLQNVVFSPYWNIPKSIIAEEILPGMQRDPSYLSRHHMEAMKGFGKDAIRVRAWEVPWYNIDDDNFQYWIRQVPGDDNPLGLVKFLFPNSYNVYLHGTSQESLFSAVKRSFSHGCIRVEDPFKVAQYVLSDQPEWTPDRIRKAMHSNEEQFVKCRHIPVYILYFTTWMDESGKVEIRDDIYGLDQLTAEQMNV